MQILLKNNSQIPTKKYDSDACFDIKATSIKIISNDKGDYIQYGTGIYSEIPEGYFIDVRPRSSIREYDLEMTNAPGTIDCHYRNEWFVCFRIHGMLNILGTLMQHQENGAFLDKDNKPVKIISENMTSEMMFEALKLCGIRMYNIGDKIAQVRLESNILTEWKLVEELAHSDRNMQGHGSTGK